MENPTPVRATGLRRPWSGVLWLLPMLVCLLVSWSALNAWFDGDDFQWLQLWPQVSSGAVPLASAVLEPTVHGTFRPLSERTFLLVFRALFDLDALPYHLWMFLTQFASLALMASILLRLTGSRVAAVAAPVFWVVNPGLAEVLAWPSAYMQILCTFCMLLAFHFLLRHIQTGRTRYYVLEWAVFLTGFGVLETNVVYPAIAAGYTLLFARHRFRLTLPMGAVSAAFLFWHMNFLPKASAGPYAMHVDAYIPVTLWKYWKWVFWPLNMEAMTGIPNAVGIAALVLSTAALVGFVAWQAWRRNWLPLFFLGWSMLLFAPLLPLRDHVVPYLLFLPTMPVALLAGCAFGAAWRNRAAWKIAATLAACLYLFVSVPSARVAAKWWRERTEVLERLVRGVRAARELHPEKTIVLTGINDDVFWGSIAQGAFKAAGVTGVYLAPETASTVVARPEYGDVFEYILPHALIAKAIERNTLVAYSAGGPKLRNITTIYRAAVLGSRTGPPARVDVGLALSDGLLGGDWYASEGTFRWMGKRGTVRMAGPTSTSARLHLSGYCAAAVLEKGPARLTVEIEGRRLGTVELTRPDAPVELDFPIPPEFAGRPAMEVTVEMDRTFRPPGTERDFGLVFVKFEVI